MPSEQLIRLLEENAGFLQKAQVNLKKCPKQRLTAGYLEARLGCIEQYWQTFKSTHQELVKCTPKEKRCDISYFVNEDYYVIEDLYLCLQGDINDTLKSLSTKISVQHLSTCETQQPQVKLPQIQLPTFAGNYNEWPTFKDFFLSLVHINTSLNKVQKLHYLKCSVDGEAQALLKHIQVTEDNYEQAWNLLEKRYENKRLIVNSILKRLFSQKKVSTQTSYHINTLLDTTTECLNNLKNININTESWDPIIIHLVVQKLDIETHKEWEHYSYKSDSSEIPTWADLKMFLETTFRTLELFTPTTSCIRDTKTVKEKSFHVSTTTPSRSCCICNENHTLSHCKEFCKMKATERNDFVKTKHLCFNCLLEGHSAIRCRLQVNCRICHRRHHSLLHEAIVSNNNTYKVNHTQTNHKQVDEEQSENDDTTNIAITSHFIAKKSTALLATAIVPVKDDKGNVILLRALIDQGSQANFISERAAQLLKVKRSSVKGIVTGVGSTQTPVRHMIEVELGSRYEEHFKLKIQAYVMSTRLTTQLPSKIIKKPMLTWPHLKGLTLADPSFHQPARIDMLLGVDVCAQIWKENIVKGPPGSPCAHNTSLGWILFGQVHEENQEEDILVMHLQVNTDEMLKTMWELDEDNKRKLTKEEEKCEEIYKQNHTRTEEGRYIVKLPFNTDKPISRNGNTRDNALKRLNYLERRFERDTKLKEEYSIEINDYIEKNHMEEVPTNEIQNDAVYLPHHAIIKEDRETTKIRPVFDASCKGTNNVSLNDELLVGPQLQEDMRYIVMRWRMKKIAYVADIELTPTYMKMNIGCCSFITRIAIEIKT